MVIRMISYTLLQDQFYIEENRISLLDKKALNIEDAVTTDGALITVRRTITNLGDVPVSFIPCISVRTENKMTDWFVPSVSYSGNDFGDGMEQKGLLCDGEPWIFPSDHAGVPGCTVVMGNEGSSALFLSPENFRSACSLEILDGAVVQRAYFTHLEYPRAYLEKFLMGDAILNEDISSQEMNQGNSEKYEAIGGYKVKDYKERPHVYEDN